MAENEKEPKQGIELILPSKEDEALMKLREIQNNHTRYLKAGKVLEKLRRKEQAQNKEKAELERELEKAKDYFSELFIRLCLSRLNISASRLARFSDQELQILDKRLAEQEKARYLNKLGGAIAPAILFFFEVGVDERGRITRKPAKLFQGWKYLKCHRILKTLSGSDYFPAEEIKRRLSLMEIREYHPLIEACRTNNLEHVNFLLENGADVHVRNNMALRIAAGDHGNKEMVQLLLDYGADIRADNDVVLAVASRLNWPDIVKLALEKGADIHSNDSQAIEGAVSRQYSEIIEMLFERVTKDNVNQNSGVALRYAAAGNYLKIAKSLLEKGADIHASNDEPLSNAARNGHLEMVKLLLEYRANTQANNSAALRCAADNGHLAVVKLLVKKGADANTIQAALTLAKQKNRFDVIEFLLKVSQAGNKPAKSRKSAAEHPG